MRLRRFTAAGLARFEELLKNASDEGAAGVPAELLSDPLFAEEVPGGADIEPRALGKTRLSAGAYLDARLTESGLIEAGRDVALWAWLSALAFDLVCPRDRGGRHRPGARACYVPDIDEARKTHRHRLLGPYLVYRAHRDAPERALCLLAQPLARPGKLVERLASRPRLVACPAVVGAATVLYCDHRGAVRRSAAGNVDRLCDVLMQLDRTYDLYGMTTDALLGLLPREFDGFKRLAGR